MPPRISVATPHNEGGLTGSLLEKAANADAGTHVLDGLENVDPRAPFRVGPAMVTGTRWPGDDVSTNYDEVSKRQYRLEKQFMASVKKATDDPMSVIEGLRAPEVAGPLAALARMSPWYKEREIKAALADLGKSFTTSSPLGSGIVPFDLLAPSMLIYNAMTPFRNRFPRTQGQGLYHRGKVMTNILGSQPGQYANPAMRTSIGELLGGSINTTYPLALPNFGTQTMEDVIIPYRFFGLSEGNSFLSQWAGQGFDDVFALAALVLQQEFMLGEERQIIGGTAVALGHSVTVSGTARSPGTGETALSGVVSSSIYVYATQVNYYGETIAGASSGTITVSGSKVVDITIANLQPGTLVTNLYVATGSADPTATGAHLMASYVGGTLYTLQGTIPTGTATPPSADTGTSSSNDYEGIFSILSGHAQANTSTTGYPSGYDAGYYLSNAASELRIAVLETALQQVYNGSSNNYFADPSEIWSSAIDIKNLADDLKQATGKLNYQLLVNQDQVNNVTAGVAVSQFTNPVTRSTVRMVVHPYFPQGSCVGLSYTMPQQQTNVGNIWENVMVQDYLTINWPIIDVVFRMSMFMYGTLFCIAPQYNFLIQGLQVSDSTPYS